MVANVKGHMNDELGDETVRKSAVEALDADVHAASHRHVVEAKLRTVEKALSFWKLPLMPPTVLHFRALGAALKYGGYRSSASYFSIYKGHLERNGFELSAPQLRAVQDAVRSCERGQGGPVRAMALPFENLRQLPGGLTPFAPGGPVSSRNALVAGSWFLMREVELSLASASSVTLSWTGSTPSVSWRLPVSKTDPKALGTSRVHGCSCTSSSSPSTSCPAHAVWDQLLLLQRRFPRRFSGPSNAMGLRQPDRDLPLFPTAEGGVCDKESVTATVRAAGRMLGVVEPADGTEQLSGHSLRVTGAQGLARLGVDLWAIQLIGRWGSDTVKNYVRGVQMERSAAWAAGAAKRMELEAVVANLVSELRSSSPSSTPSAPPSSSMSSSTSSTAAPSSTSLAAVASTSWLDENVANSCGQKSALDEEVALAADASKKVNPVETFVLSSTRVWHLVARGPPEFRMEFWTTSCGWTFGGSKSAKLGDLGDLPSDPLALCARCLPELRQAAKVKVANAIKEQ